MAPRLLALIAAVAMVAGSVALRARLDDEGGPSGRGGGGRPRLVCSTEVAAACEALGDDADATVEPAGTTLDRLVGAEGADPGLDGWLVAGPWPRMVDLLRDATGRDPWFGDAGAPLARSPLVVAIWPERAEALRARACGRQVDWRCLGEAAQKPWSELGGPFPGAVRPGHGDARTGAVGLAAVGAAVAGYFGRADLDLLDLDDDGFRAWFTRLEDGADHRGQVSPLAQMLVTQRAEYDAVATVEAEAAPAVAAVPANRPALIYPEPVATADVVLGTPGGTGGDRVERLTERLRDALHAGGWRVGDRPPPTGADASVPLPPASRLPSPGVLLALREEVASG